MHKKVFVLHVGVLKIKWGHVFGICEALVIKGYKWPWGEVKGALGNNYEITNIYAMSLYKNILNHATHDEEIF